MPDNNIPTRIYPSPQPIIRPSGTGKQSPLAPDAPKFADLLREQLATDGLKFSKHAELRLQARQIPLTNLDLERLTRAVDRAAEKGARDSLILMNQTAFVVNIKNRTVITAVDGASMQDNVFTNIDSAVIVE